MRYYAKRIIQFAVFGLIGFSVYNFGLRFIEPVTKAEAMAHTIATITYLLLSVIGFFGAYYFTLCLVFDDEANN